MNGHLLKYKDSNGNWVSIPVLIQDMYNAYVTYCENKGISNIATEEEYYRSVGDLSTLVKQFGENSEALSSLSHALEKGVLPMTMGGTGAAVSEKYKTFKEYLVDSEKSGGLDLVPRSEVQPLQENIEKACNAYADELWKSKIASGTEEPKDDLVADFYFQTND
jgi:hypothetical protein